MRLLGKYFHDNDLNCERFWFLFGLSPDDEISKNRFTEVMCKSFEGGDRAGQLWQKMWDHFDRGRGAILVAVLCREMGKYEIVDS